MVFESRQFYSHDFLKDVWDPEEGSSSDVITVAECVLCGALVLDTAVHSDWHESNKREDTNG